MNAKLMATTGTIYRTVVIISMRSQDSKSFWWSFWEVILWKLLEAIDGEGAVVNIQYIRKVLDVRE